MVPHSLRVEWLFNTLLTITIEVNYGKLYILFLLVYYHIIFIYNYLGPLAA